MNKLILRNVAAVFGTALSSSVLLSTIANAGIINKHPDILVCSVSEDVRDATWQDLVFYVSGTQKDGAVLYKSLTSNPVLIRINEAGILSAPKLANCDNQSVQTLREAGRAKDFGR